MGDVRKDPRYLALIPETRSELVVPLVHKDRVVGVFDLESSVLDRFTDEHVKVLTPLASQVAVAIENARLYESWRGRRSALGRELEIAQRVQQGLFPEEPPAGAGLGRLRPLPPRHASWAATSTTSTSSGEGVLGRGRGRRAGQGRAGRALRRLRLGQRPRARLRAAGARRPA